MLTSVLRILSSARGYMAMFVDFSLLSKWLLFIDYLIRACSWCGNAVVIKIVSTLQGIAEGGG